MKVNLLQPVEALDADGTMILNKEGKPPSLKEIVLFALRAPHTQDQSTGLKEKEERFLITKRVEQVDEIELTQPETKMIAERVGKLFLQIEIVGKVAEMLRKSASPEGV